MLDDLECVKRIQYNSDEDSLKMLIDRHSGIYVEMVNRHICKPFLEEVKQDLISDKDSFIFECAKKYDPSRKTKFSTYLGNMVRWRCKNIFNNSKNKNLYHKIVPLEYTEEVFHQPDIFEEVDIHEKQSIIQRVLDSYPDERAIKIFQLRYTEGAENKVMPWKRIAKKLDLSSQGCIDIHNKLIKTIRKTYEQSSISWKSDSRS